jgi:hypothetical protein
VPFGIWSIGGCNCSCAGPPAPNTTILCTGCTSLPVPGLIVKVWTSSAESSLVFSGTTDALGQIYGYIPSNGTYWVDFSATSGNSGGVWGRFNSLAARSVGLTIGSTASTSLGAAASGYECTAACWAPLKTTLFLTDSVYGAVTLTYSGGNWIGSYSGLSYPGCGACGPITFVGPWLSYSFDASLTTTWAANPATGYCPGGGTPAFCIYPGTSSCPSASSNTYSWSGGGTPSSCNHTGSNLAYCSTPTFTVSE